MASGSVHCQGNNRAGLCVGHLEFAEGIEGIEGIVAQGDAKKEALVWINKRVWQFRAKP